MALHHKWDVKNDFAYGLQFFLLISDGLGSVAHVHRGKRAPNPIKYILTLPISYAIVWFMIQLTNQKQCHGLFIF